jgi:hypothetical protein
MPKPLGHGVAYAVKSGNAAKESYREGYREIYKAISGNSSLEEGRPLVTLFVSMDELDQSLSSGFLRSDEEFVGINFDPQNLRLSGRIIREAALARPRATWLHTELVQALSTQVRDNRGRLFEFKGGCVVADLMNEIDQKRPRTSTVAAVAMRASQLPRSLVIVNCCASNPIKNGGAWFDPVPMMKNIREQQTYSEQKAWQLLEPYTYNSTGHTDMLTLAFWRAS